MLAEQAIHRYGAAADDEQEYRGSEDVDLLEDRLEGERLHRHHAKQCQDDRGGTCRQADAEEHAADAFNSKEREAECVTLRSQGRHEQNADERRGDKRDAEMHAECKRGKTSEPLERTEHLWLL